MKNDINEQYRRNNLALREARLSPKRRFLLRLAPVVGVLGFLYLAFSDFYEWGDGDVSAVSVAIWQLYTSDKKMVQITEEPLKYLTLEQYVDDGIIETMDQDGWYYLGDNLFERNGQKISVDINFVTREFVIVEFDIEE